MAMAYRRNDFKNKVEEHLGGALLEFYKSQLAEKNGYTKWVRHWRSEVRQLLTRSLVATLLHEVRGFKDRRKAFDEVVLVLRAEDHGYRRASTHQVTRDFEVRKLRHPLSDEDTEEFWAQVKKATDAVWGS